MSLNKNIKTKTAFVSIAGVIVLGSFFAVWANTQANITVLDVYSHPQAGDNWRVSFMTEGRDDLYIMPEDKATENDLEFLSLKCGEQERTAQLLENSVIFYPNWRCQNKGEIVYLVNKAGHHTLRFQFKESIEYAYNNPDSVQDDFNDNSMIDTDKTENLVIAGGEIELAEEGVPTTIIYVPDLEHDGDFGGRSGADAFCRTNKPANLPASCSDSDIHAFLSIWEDEIWEMPTNYGYDEAAPIYWWNSSTGATTKFANDWDDMLDGSIEVSDWEGTGVGEEWYWRWSGSEEDGTFTYNCDDWTDNSSEWGVYGEVTETGVDWLYGSAESCDIDFFINVRCVAECPLSP